jgi:hypothetical protein
MALNSSGPISLAGSTAGQSIAVELGQSASGTISLNDTNVRTLAGVPSGAITMPTNFWGKSNSVGWVLYTGFYPPSSGIPSAGGTGYQSYGGINLDSSGNVTFNIWRGAGTQRGFRIVNTDGTDLGSYGPQAGSSGVIVANSPQTSNNTSIPNFGFGLTTYFNWDSVSAPNTWGIPWSSFFRLNNSGSADVSNSNRGNQLYLDASTSTIYTVQAYAEGKSSRTAFIKSGTSSGSAYYTSISNFWPSYGLFKLSIGLVVISSPSAGTGSPKIGILSSDVTSISNALQYSVPYSANTWFPCANTSTNIIFLVNTLSSTSVRVARIDASSTSFTCTHSVDIAVTSASTSSYSIATYGSYVYIWVARTTSGGWLIVLNASNLTFAWANLFSGSNFGLALNNGNALVANSTGVYFWTFYPSGLADQYSYLVKLPLTNTLPAKTLALPGGNVTISSVTFTVTSLSVWTSTSTTISLTNTGWSSTTSDRSFHTPVSFSNPFTLTKYDI